MVEHIESDSIKNLSNNNGEKDNRNDNENENLLINQDRSQQNDYFKDLIRNNNNTTDQKDSFFQLDLSKYKSTKVFGITFYKIGNLYVFGFIKNSSEPLFCIDNMWYFNLIIYIIIVVLAFTGNYYLFRKLELWKQIIYNILLVLFSILFSILILLNPGINIKSKKGYNHIAYCKLCNIYFRPEDKIYHCFECNVCVKQLDHHCSFLRKCITKKNFIYFFLMLANFIILYLFSILYLILYLIDYYKKIKKKII